MTALGWAPGWYESWLWDGFWLEKIIVLTSIVFHHLRKVGGIDPPFGSALGISHRFTINGASPLEDIDSAFSL